MLDWRNAPLSILGLADEVCFIAACYVVPLAVHSERVHAGAVLGTPFPPIVVRLAREPIVEVERGSIGPLPVAFLVAIGQAEVDVISAVHCVTSL